MSLFGQRKQKNERKSPQPQLPVPEKPKLTFHCQQAHGSPTGIISGFSNVKELYEKIAECYDISSKDVSKLCFALLKQFNLYPFRYCFARSTHTKLT